MISNAQYTDPEHTVVNFTLQDGRRVPTPVGGRFADRIQEWIDEGNTIADYVPPPQPTGDEQINGWLAHSPWAIGLVWAIADLTGKTEAQVISAIKSRMP